MEVQLGGLHCLECPRYKEFFEALEAAEQELALREIEYSGDEYIKPRVTPAKFICKTVVQTGCRAEMTPARLELEFTGHSSK